MDKKTVREMLNGASENDYIEIIQKMSKTGDRAEKVILDWGKKHNEQYRAKAVEIEVENLWKKAEKIIDRFNSYGGGPESEEDKAYNALGKMQELVQEQDLPWDFKQTIVDGMLYQFSLSNSGFDDFLIDTATVFCTRNEEKRYLADYLANGRGYYADYAARIYRSLGSQEDYLKVKLDNLEYASDYVELAKYYAKKDRKKSWDYIWQGLEQSLGCKGELINYAVPVFLKENREQELERLYKLVIKQNNSSDIATLAGYLYKYYKKKSDYAQMKKTLMIILNYCDPDKLKGWFKECGNSFAPDDWKNEYEDILAIIKNRNIKLYLDIRMENGKEEEVLNYILNNKRTYWRCNLDDNRYFTQRLAEKYPDEITDYYWKKVQSLLQVTNNRNYEEAVGYLKAIQAIRKKNGKNEMWEKEFMELKMLHKKKRNFITMLSVFE